MALEWGAEADTAAVQLQDHATAPGPWAPPRARAVARVVAVGTPRKVVARTSRIVLFLTGLGLVGVAVGVMLWNKLGPGPLDVFVGAVRVHTGLPLSVALWVTVGTVLAAAWLLGRRPGVGSFVGPLAIGPVMQVVVEQLAAFDVPSALVARLSIHVAAIAVVGLGAGAIVASGLGAGSGELFSAAASERVGYSQPRIRFVVELTWVALGVALGGPIGVGTVLVALLIGPAVAHGHRMVESFMNASRRQLDLVAA